MLLGQVELEDTGLRDNGSQAIETTIRSGIPKLLAKAISDDIALGGLESLVLSSVLLELFLFCISDVLLGIESLSIGLIGGESLELGSLKLSGSLTDEEFSGKFGLGFFLSNSLCLGDGIQLSLLLSFSLSFCVLLGNGGTL